MSEFQEVMRQWGRYCKGYTENHNDDCDGCPFEINGSCNSYAKDNAQYAEQIEKHVMAWANEHPEPVYPTWYRWLIMMGAISSVEDMFSDLQHTIPADIAERLGIEGDLK